MWTTTAWPVADETALRAPGRRIAVIDDLAERPRDCDLVLDPGYGRTAADYAGLARPGATILTGPRYALVRPQFAAARPAALARRGAGPVRRALVSLGLTDVGAVTGQVVEVLAPHLGEVTLDVVLGRGAPSRERLEALAATDPRIVLHVEALDMARLIAAADLGVGAGGSSTWERCCLGLPIRDPGPGRQPAAPGAGVRPGRDQPGGGPGDDAAGFAGGVGAAC